MTQSKDPSPEEITRMCAEIQASWSQQERLKRLRVDLRPMVRTADDRLCDVSAEHYEQHLERTGCDT